MANPVLDFNLGAYIQIAYSKGIRNQISEDFRDFEYIKRAKVGNPDGRELKFMFKNGYGPSANQFSKVTDYGFAKGQQVSVSEYSAEYQDWDCTVEFDYKLWDRARKNPNTYGDFLAEELSSKILSQKRLFAKTLYGDGTDAVIENSGAPDETDIATGRIVVTAASAEGVAGSIGWVEYDEIIVPAEQDGTPRAPTGGTDFYGYRVLDKKRKTGVVTLETINSSHEVITDVTASNIADTDVFYRVGLDSTATRFDRTAAVGSTDFGKQIAFPGYESLAANDGRLVHGITMSGRTGATVEDAGDSTLANEFIENMLNDTKIRVGESAYSYKMLCASPEAHSKFILDREASRRFNTQDTTEGGKKFTYQHRNDALEVYASEFVPARRMYCLPEARNGNKVLEMHSTDFETVKVNDTSAFHLAVENGGFAKKIVTYMTGKGTMICKHPAAIGVLKNFKLTA